MIIFFPHYKRRLYEGKFTSARGKLYADIIPQQDAKGQVSLTEILTLKAMTSQIKTKITKKIKHLSATTRNARNARIKKNEIRNDKVK